MNKFSTNINSINTKPDNTEEEINIREIIFKYLQYWKWFVLSAILFLALGVLIYLKMDREYEVSTSVLLKEDNGSGSQKNGPLGGLEQLGLLGTTNNVDNEIAVFSSPNLIKQIVLALELQTTYHVNGLIRDTEIYTESPYYVRLEDLKPDDLVGDISFVIEKKGEAGANIKGKHTIKSEETSFDLNIEKLPGFIELPVKLGRLYVACRPNIVPENEDDTYTVHIENAQRMAYDLAKLIKINPTTKSSSVLNININVQNVNKGIDILNEIVKIYNNNNIEENNQMASNTSVFINDQLRKISTELSSVENRVVNFKKEQGITDLGSEAKIYVEQTSHMEEERRGIETQVKTIELVENFLQKGDNSHKLIPNLGITDPGLSKIISEYNTNLLAFQRLETSTSEGSPSRIKALSELTNTRSGIEAAVNNVKKALNISKREIEKQTSLISSRIHSIPSQEKGLLEITRQQQIQQALFVYLMQVDLETGITMASHSEKAKVITDPIIPDNPISPKRNAILLASLLIGLIIPIGVIYIKDLLQLNITSREELESLSNVTIIGEIMKKDDDDDIIVVRKNKTTPIVELFRTLRNNIQFVMDEPEKKLILVTSTVPGEGKTFVSINLATSFALSDKKVLLLGMDIRNPKLAADMGFRKGTGLTSYLSGSESDWKSMITKIDDFPHLHVLQAGAIPPNPNELLMKPSLKKLIDEARQSYDIIIIDSAPIGVVSDTFLLSSLADATIYVTREKVTPKNAVIFINDIHADSKLPNMYLVINGVELSKNKSKYGRYGYGYTYGYGETNE